MPNNCEHNTFLIFFLKQKIEWHSFNSSDSAFRNLANRTQLLMTAKHSLGRNYSCVPS